MTKRNEGEMAALLAKFHEQLGPLDKWSDAAQIRLQAWVKELDQRCMEIDQDLLRCNCDD